MLNDWHQTIEQKLLRSLGAMNGNRNVFRKNLIVKDTELFLATFYIASRDNLEGT